MQKAPAKRNGDDGLPIPPYKVYNIGGGQPENLLGLRANVARGTRPCRCAVPGLRLRGPQAAGTDATG